jgi:cytochrome c peroxidase
VSAQEAGQKGSSYAPVDITEDFATTMARMKAAKPEVMKRQIDLLNARYDLDFPPAPKLTAFGKLDPTKATEAELRGQALFFGKAQCATCHPAPYYTDNLMHNLRVEHFYTPQMVNGRLASAEGPIKTFPLRGIKDSPPYLHDDRLLTLDDTVEFFNLVLELKLSEPEKQDLVAFLSAV